MEPELHKGTPYRVIQLGAPQGANATQRNEDVPGFDSLVTPHPAANRHARMVDGRIIDGERGRAHAFISDAIEEIEVARGGRTFGLHEDQVLLKKDFILEHPHTRRAAGPPGMWRFRRRSPVTSLSAVIARVASTFTTGPEGT